jgi:hypothetical protein
MAAPAWETWAEGVRTGLPCSLIDDATCQLLCCCAGPQTLFGYQLATGLSQRVGLVAGVGEDLPPECKVDRLPLSAHM